MQNEILFKSVVINAILVLSKDLSRRQKTGGVFQEDD